MPSNNCFPDRVVVQAKGTSPDGLCVCLRFEMRIKNSFNYIVFLDSHGAASVSAEELLRVFDEERQAFMMDYDDPRIGFTGKVTVKMLSTVELKNALEAFNTFRGKLSFPEDYEARLKAALQRGQNPDEYPVEVRTVG